MSEFLHVIKLIGALILVLIVVAVIILIWVEVVEGPEGRKFAREEEARKLRAEIERQDRREKANEFRAERDKRAEAKAARDKAKEVRARREGENK